MYTQHTHTPKKNNNKIKSKSNSNSRLDSTRAITSSFKYPSRTKSNRREKKSEERGYTNHQERLDRSTHIISGI